MSGLFGLWFGQEVQTSILFTISLGDHSQLSVASPAVCARVRVCVGRIQVTVFLWVPVPAPSSPAFLVICWTSQLDILSVYYLHYKSVILTKCFPRLDLPPNLPIFQ